MVYYTTFLYNVTNEYISYVIGIIGVVTVINGIYTIIRWKKDKKEYYPLISVPMLIPSICCFVGSFFTAILLNNKNTEPDFLLISVTMSVLFAIIITIFYLFSNFLRHAERPYTILLGNFMILNGFFFVIAGLFIPTIESMIAIQTHPLAIDSASSMIFLIMAGLGVLLVGVYLKTEGKTV
jgi:predicted transporter